MLLVELTRAPRAPLTPETFVARTWEEAVEAYWSPDHRAARRGVPASAPRRDYSGVPPTCRSSAARVLGRACSGEPAGVSEVAVPDTTGPVRRWSRSGSLEGHEDAERPRGVAGRSVPRGVRRVRMSVSATDRGVRREEITEQLLTALEGVVWRYRALRPPTEDADLYAEVVTAEVAHQLEVARSALRRTPSIDAS